jgi:hypothetical protein
MLSWHLILVLLTSALAHVDSAVNNEVDLTCHVCNSSYYCVGGQQFHCPSNSLAAVILADSIAECVCNPGFLREGDVCTLGQPPAWYAFGNSSSCVHTRETIASGASGHADCVCVPGFASLPVAEALNCQPCAPDTYTDVHNMSQCDVCPTHSSHNLTQRSTVKACLCDPGYTGPDGGPCAACEAGTFKLEPGAAACKQCGVNEYSHAAASECVACHGNSSSASGSTDVHQCLCDPGFYPLHGSCSLCRPGHFKNTSANNPCEPCVENSFAAEQGATACTSCLASALQSSAWPSEGGVRCQCNAGYTQTELGLVTPECSACPVNTFQPSAGQTVCEQCHASAYAPQASVTPLACLCNAGFFDNNEHECKACEGGTYKGTVTADSDDTQPCNTCPANSFSALESGAITDCRCNAGFSGQDGGQCTACAPGTFKASNGSDMCEYCPLHTYSAASASTVCLSCAALLNSEGGITVFPGQIASSSCVCDVSRGFTEVLLGGARACSACQLGTYATDSGCRNCSNGTYADERWLTACKHCPANMSSYDYLFVGCQCSKGYKCNSENSVLTFMNNATSCRCDACQNNTFKDYTGAASACQACHAFSESVPAATSQDMCLCKRGYRQNGPHVCVACAPGTYSDALDVLACSVCPAESYTPSAQAPWDTLLDCQACAVCNKTTNTTFTDHYDAARAGLGCGLDQQSSCQACPAAASLFLQTTQSQRNKGITSCVCDPHFYGAKGTVCTACPSNQVRTDFINADTTLADCLCSPGFEPNPGAEHLCRQCPIGKYKPLAGDHNCTTCPATLTTETLGNTSAAACICAPGHGHAAGVCTQCSANTFKSGFNMQSCSPCPEHTAAAPGSDKIQACVCVQHHGRNGILCVSSVRPATTRTRAVTTCVSSVRKTLLLERGL